MLTSTFLDCVSNFIVRYLGTDPDQPPSLVPFVQGICVAPVVLVYILIFDLAKLKDITMHAVLLSVVGGIISWMSQEMLNAGVSVSKSGLGQMGFQVGIIVPIIYDALVGKRSIMFIDYVGLAVIISI